MWATMLWKSRCTRPFGNLRRPTGLHGWMTLLRMVAGKPLLGWQIARLQRSRLLDEIIVATSTSSDDDVLEHFCDQNEIRCFRGSENDVLGRIAGAIEAYDIETHVELYWG